MNMKIKVKYYVFVDCLCKHTDELKVLTNLGNGTGAEREPPRECFANWYPAAALGWDTQHQMWSRPRSAKNTVKSCTFNIICINLS